MDTIDIYFKHFKRNANSRFVVLQGSSRSGKTFSTMQWLLYLALNNVRLEITVVGRTIPFLRDGSVSIFKKIAPNYRLIKSPFSATVKKTDFLFRSFENEDDAKGSERDILYVNECNDVNFKVVEQLIMRTRKQVIFDYNPTKKFWIDDYINEINFLKTTWQDNQFLSEGQKQNFELIKQKAERENASAFDKYLYSVFYLGEYGNIKGNVFGNVSQCSVHEYEEATKYSKKICGLDFGFSVDPCALVEVSIVLGTLYVKQLVYKSEINDFGLSDEIKQKVDEETYIVGDFGGGGDARMSNLFELTGRTFIKAQKGAGSVLNGVEVLNTFPIVICGDEAFSEFSGYEIKDGEFVDKDNHTIDATRYAVDYAIRAKFFQ